MVYRLLTITSLLHWEQSVANTKLPHSPIRGSPLQSPSSMVYRLLTITSLLHREQSASTQNSKPKTQNSSHSPIRGSPLQSPSSMVYRLSSPIAITTQESNLPHALPNMVYSTNADEVDAELATVTAEITALDANIATLPEGELKREQVKKKKKAESKQFLLTEKQHDYGVVALLNKEYVLTIIDLQLTELNAFIAALEARKAAIA